MSQEELNKILDLHKKWLNKEKGGVQANLSGFDLSGVDLSRTNLQYVNMCGADLSGANLQCVNMSGANLWMANLRRANLVGTNLRHANLIEADLCGADMRWADMDGTNLREADMTDVDLRGTNLVNANLYGANMKDIKYGATTAFLALQCPEEGAFIAYKNVDHIIIKLEVPADAKRSSATTRKCRCSKAKVLGFYGPNRNELDIDEVENHRYTPITYRKGEMVYPDKWDNNRWNECSNGIHFFLTFEEAKNLLLG